jgi:hypothetical protein
VIRSGEVDRIASALARDGIGHKIYYRPAMHHHPRDGPVRIAGAADGDRSTGRDPPGHPDEPWLTQQQVIDVTQSIAGVFAQTA